MASCLLMSVTCDLWYAFRSLLSQVTGLISFAPAFTGKLSSRRLVWVHISGMDEEKSRGEAGGEGVHLMWCTGVPRHTLHTAIADRQAGSLCHITLTGQLSADHHGACHWFHVFYYAYIKILSHHRRVLLVLDVSLHPTVVICPMRSWLCQIL